MRPGMNHFRLGLITGASAGLGKALAKALSEQGMPLILVARDEKRLKSLAAELPTQSTLCPADLSTQEGRHAVTALIHKMAPDLIINNAGFGLYGPTLAHPVAELQEIVEVNIQALIAFSVEGARALAERKQKGTILNVSSAAGFYAYPHFSVYAASKAFVNSFSQALDFEMRPEGIRVLTVCPGQIATDFRKRSSGAFPQKKDHITMTTEKAVSLILEQIEKGKRLSIIDWRYRFAVYLSKFLPSSLLAPFFMSGLKSRHAFKLD